MRRILELTNSDPGEWTVVLRRTGRQVATLIGSDRPYEAGGIAQLGIVAYALAEAHAGRLDMAEMLKLKRRHKKPGTGILRVFPSGCTISLERVMRLVLIESDITATNMLLELVGGQRVVNQWLRDQHGLVTTGLADREDRLYLSDVIKPLDALKLLDVTIMGSGRLYFLGQLAKNHHLAGLWTDLGHGPYFPEEASGAAAMRAVRSVARNDRSVLDAIIDKVIARASTSTVASLKEGILPAGHADAHSYFHQVGRMARAVNGRIVDADVVVFSRDGSPGTMALIGLAVYDWLAERDKPPHVS